MLTIATTTKAQGWPEKYQGVMLQGFYWDSYDDSRWTKLEAQADELSKFFKLVWIPQSANCGGTSMGYDDLYWFSDYNSSFGSEEQLRSMINTFKGKGIGTIADVVINHRKNVSNWVDFPKETYKGVTYELKSTDICLDDDGGATNNWATANGYSLSPNKDTGEGWDGMRDLDHNSENVQNNVRAYLDLLLNDLGYAGFRYDMVKGYAGQFTGKYNSEAKPTFSVGEYWDGNVTALKNWMDATKVNGQIQSGAFDFAVRYTVRDAINGNNWGKLSTGGVCTNKDYQRYAVTFIENHDTEYRSSQAQQDPIRKDTLAGNAFILAMPGTPCVFFKHWIDCKKDIKNMILVRNFAGINNQSTSVPMNSNQDYYSVRTEGTNCYLRAYIGTKANEQNPGNDWVKVAYGHKYAYFLPTSAETAWTDLPDGTYKTAQKAKLIAVSAASDAKLVYTLDGSTPTASSTQVANGTSIDIAETCILKVGLLLPNGAVTGITTREYTFEQETPFNPYQITVCVNVDDVNWSKVNFWTWGGDGSHSPKSPNWPGDAVTQTKTVNNQMWYYQTYTINSSDDYVSFVFSTGSGSPQTVDVTNVTTDKYFKVTTGMQGDKYLVSDVTETTGIDDAIIDNLSKKHKGIYTIDGRKINATSINTLPNGVYIIDGKKVILHNNGKRNF